MYLVLTIFIVSTFFISCEKEKTGSVDFLYDPETTPTLSTDSVTMLISDSGYIRYKLITQTWDVYDGADDPYWYFPNKIYVEQYDDDTLANVVGIVKADTVWNYTNRKLWKLKGNVYIQNALGETFLGDELFWDERKQKVYSDKYIEIHSPGKGILRGQKFESNQQMTDYKFYKVGGTELYLKDTEETN